MRAIKMAVQVTRDHELHLELPEEIEEGPAEVIVLVPEPAATMAAPLEPGALSDFLAGPRVDSRFRRSQAEIDAYLRAERDSWE